MLHFAEELRSFIREKDVEDIHFKEPLSQADLSLWMSAADSLALPSYYEGFGSVALEAMSAGTKSSCHGCWRALLSCWKIGLEFLVEPENPASLAEGLWKVLDGEPGDR